MDTSSPVLMQMITNTWIPQALYVAVQARIPEQLKNGPQPVSQLAETAQAHPKSLYRVLRALAGIGVLEEGAGQTFSLTPLGHFLQPDVPGSVAPMVRMFGEEHFKVWSGLWHSIQTGESAFSHVYGQPFFDYLEGHPEASEAFNQAMTAFSQQSVNVAASYNFAQFDCLMDVGGGQGYLLSAILKTAPSLKGVLFDLDHVLEGASEVLRSQNVLERCTLAGGSFFETGAIPAGANAYLLSHILHDWDDARCNTILQNIHQVIPADGRLLIVETVIGSPKETQMSRFMDLNMLVMTEGGCERTEDEFAQLLAANGFQLKALHPVQEMERYVIEATVINIKG